MKIEFLNPERTRARLTRRPFPWTRAYVAEVTLWYDDDMPYPRAQDDVMKSSKPRAYTWRYVVEGGKGPRVEGDFHYHAKNPWFDGAQGELHDARSGLIRAERKAVERQERRVLKQHAREKAQRDREECGRMWRPTTKLAEARVVREGGAR